MKAKKKESSAGDKVTARRSGVTRIESDEGIASEARVQSVPAQAEPVAPTQPATARKRKQPEPTEDAAAQDTGSSSAVVAKKKRSANRLSVVTSNAKHGVCVSGCTFRVGQLCFMYGRMLCMCCGYCAIAKARAHRSPANYTASR